MTARILIAEDEPFILESLTFLFEREGYALATVENGSQVMEMVRQHEPDLLVLDAMLPGKDGFSVLGDVRADATLAELKVLVLTAKGQDADRQRMMALGANAFVTKPFSNQELMGTIKDLLGGKAVTAATYGDGGHG